MAFIPVAATKTVVWTTNFAHKNKTLEIRPRQ